MSQSCEPVLWWNRHFKLRADNEPCCSIVLCNSNVQAVFGREVAGASLVGDGAPGIARGDIEASQQHRESSVAVSFSRFAAASTIQRRAACKDLHAVCAKRPVPRAALVLEESEAAPAAPPAATRDHLVRREREGTKFRGASVGRAVVPCKNGQQPVQSI